MICDAAKLIKDAVDIRNVCELYGVHFNSRNQANCPFHEDKHPSASIKHGRFHCYVCNLHLDIFDFVTRITGCDFPDAKKLLNDAFHLGLNLDKPVSSDEMRRIEAERRRKAKELDDYRVDYNAHQEEFILLHRLARMCRPSPDEPYMGEYAWAIGRLDQLTEYFSEHPWR